MKIQQRCMKFAIIMVGMASTNEERVSKAEKEINSREVMVISDKIYNGNA